MRVAGYYLILGIATAYAALYAMHAFRRRALAAGLWSLLLALLPSLCIAALIVEP